MKSGQILKCCSCDVVRAAVPVTYHNSVSPDGLSVPEDKNRCGACRRGLPQPLCNSNFTLQSYFQLLEHWRSSYSIANVVHANYSVRIFKRGRGHFRHPASSLFTPAGFQGLEGEHR